MKIAIITSGILPVPASQGGAVESLVDNFINTNEIYKKANVTIFSIWDIQALELAQKYKYSEFIFIQPNWLVRKLDKFLYSLVKKIFCLDKSISFRYLFQRLFFLNKVSSLLRENDYQKVIIENHPSIFLALKWRKNYLKYESRYYHHLHNRIVGTFGCKSIIKKSKNIICVSAFILNHLSEILGVQDNLSVLRNCVDQVKFTQQLMNGDLYKLRMEYGISEQERVLLFTGRISEEKGIKELLLALQQIKANHYKLLIVGSSFFSLEIKNQFEEAIVGLIEPIKDKVVFTGFIPYEKISNFYAIADIAVLPSVWEDPAPLTIIESLSSGLPIITTNSGGIPEYVNPKCAFIIERDENLVANIAKNIDLLLSDDNLIEEMGKESLLAAENLNLENYYFNLLSLLNK